MKSNIPWSIYQKCLLSSLAGKEMPEVEVAEIRREMKKRGALFARWTSDWDALGETQWWYCIRDTKISLESLTAKQRYRVKRGLNNCDIILVSPTDYIDGLYEVYCKSLSSYPKWYKPQILDYEIFASLLKNYHCDTWVAVHKESGLVIGYALCSEENTLPHYGGGRHFILICLH